MIVQKQNISSTHTTQSTLQSKLGAKKFQQRREKELRREYKLNVAAVANYDNENWKIKETMREEYRGEKKRQKKGKQTEK